SDLIIFMVDGLAGLSGGDEQIASILRKSGKSVVLAVNKIDNPKLANNKMEFYRLGIGDPHGLSASRGDGGVGDLLDAVVSHFDDALIHESSESDEVPLPDGDFSLAIVGKPNVGKSSIINRLCGTERSVVTSIPGTTRDAVNSVIKHKDRSITLVD